MPGTWHGKLATQLGLEGLVMKDQFYAISENQHPQNGQKLKPRIRVDSVPGWDFTVSVPKSVSLLYGLTQDKEILGAFSQAVDSMMEAIEGDVQTRVRKNGRNEDRKTGAVLWAKFIHTTSRPVDGIEDPHLHCHAYMPNLTFDPEEQRYKAAKIREVWENAPYYEALFDKIIVSNLQELGYGIAEISDGWELAGFDRQTIEKFSRRTLQVEQIAKEKGILQDKLKSTIGARTRNHKREDISAEALREIWWERLTDDEKNGIDTIVQKPVNPSPSTSIISPKQAMENACNICFKRRSQISEKRLEAMAIRQGISSLSWNEVHQELKQSIKQTNLTTLRTLTGKTLITTPAIQQAKQQVITFAKESLNRFKPLNPEWKSYPLSSVDLGESEQETVRAVLASYNQLIPLTSPKHPNAQAFFQEIYKGIAQAGRKIFNLSPDLPNFGLKESLQPELEDQVLWVQAAHQLGILDLDQLLQLGKDQHARIILSPDPLNAKSRAFGDGLLTIEREAGLVPSNLKRMLRDAAPLSFAHSKSMTRALQLRRMEQQENIHSNDINPMAFIDSSGRIQ